MALCLSCASANIARQKAASELTTASNKAARRPDNQALQDKLVVAKLHLDVAISNESNHRAICREARR